MFFFKHIDLIIRAKLAAFVLARICQPMLYIKQFVFKLKHTNLNISNWR